MSCICQYIASSSVTMNDNEEPIGFALPNASDNDAVPATGEDGPGNSSTEPVTDDAKISICVSEMADCRAENWLLKKKLEEHEATIQNMEHLLTTIMDKQHQMLGDVIQLRQRNQELQIECNLQREFHTMERNTLMKELNNVKSLFRDHMCTLSGEQDDSNESEAREDEEPLGSDVDENNEVEEMGYEDDMSTDEDEDEDGDEDEDEDASAPSSANDSMCSSESDSDESEDEYEEESPNELVESFNTESESD